MRSILVVGYSIGIDYYGLLFELKAAPADYTNTAEKRRLRSGWSCLPLATLRPLCHRHAGDFRTIQGVSDLTSGVLPSHPGYRGLADRKQIRVEREEIG
jgi:hypothetical protein